VRHGVRYGLAVCGLLLAITAYAEYDFPFYGGYGDLKCLPPQDRQNHEFTFVRLIYNGRIPGYIKNWYTDYPKGERRLIEVFGRLTGVDVAPESRALPIHHPDLFNYPFLYSVEGGQMMLDQEDAKRLREYLDRGGFWMIDDFWGSFEWHNFEREIKKVTPELEIVDLPLDHPIFHSFFDIDELVQVPNSGYPYCNCPTWEQDGYTPQAKGIFDHTGRLLVYINHNTDLMDGSEWADDPKFPEYFSAHSYRMFTNALIYAITH
jgi:hypothetical protein